MGSLVTLRDVSYRVRLRAEGGRAWSGSDLGPREVALVVRMGGSGEGDDPNCDVLLLAPNGPGWIFATLIREVGT